MLGLTIAVSGRFLWEGRHSDRVKQSQVSHSEVNRMAPLSATESAKTLVHQTLSPEELRKVHAYWRAANFLSVGQIYLYANPLLREPLSLQHIKPRLLGHWGTTPALNFIYVHLNRLIKQNNLDVIYIA